MNRTIFSNKQRQLPPPKTSELLLMLDEAAKLAKLPISENRPLALNFLSAKQIKILNKTFLGHDFVTDVISFAYGNDPEISENSCFPELTAEIFVCPEKALEYAQDKGDVSAYPQELALYVVHGILHAAGELDETPAQKRRMRAREKTIIKKLSKKFDFRKIFPVPPCKVVSRSLREK